MQVAIKFKRTGSHSVYGNFAAGDVLRCDAALAAFYVADGVARYLENPQKAPAEAENRPAEAPKQAGMGKGRGKGK